MVVKLLIDYVSWATWIFRADPIFSFSKNYWFGKIINQLVKDEAGHFDLI